MADRYLVLTPGQIGDSHASLEEAESAASRGVGKDRCARVIVKVVAEVRERKEPNVAVTRIEPVEAANG